MALPEPGRAHFLRTAWRVIHAAAVVALLWILLAVRVHDCGGDEGAHLSFDHPGGAGPGLIILVVSGSLAWVALALHSAAGRSALVQRSQPIFVNPAAVALANFAVTVLLVGGGLALVANQDGLFCSGPAHPNVVFAALLAGIGVLAYAAHRATTIR